MVTVPLFGVIMAVCGCCFELLALLQYLAHCCQLLLLPGLRNAAEPEMQVFDGFPNREIVQILL